MKKQKGFTLIELLVVIAIIGLLSTIAIVAMSGARGKARDSKRISDVKQISTILDVENAAKEGGVTLLGCIAADAETNTCSNPGDINDSFGAGAGGRMCDPGSATACGLAACTSLSVGTAACDYSISLATGAAGNPTTNDYEICFFMETGNQFSTYRGIYRMEKGGKVTVPGAADGNVCL